MRAAKKHITVIGAGIAGSAVAFYALKRGAKVTLIDQSPITASTTWASGGMLVPLAEMLTGGLLELGLKCRECYPAFIAELNQVAHTKIQLKRGALTPLEPFEGRAASSAYFEQHARYGQPVSIVQQPQNYAGPELRNVERAAWVPQDGWVNPRQLLQGLHAAIANLGGSFIQERVLAINSNALVLQSGSKIQSEVIVVCAGHNSRFIDGIDWSRWGKITGERGILIRLGNVAVPRCVIFDHSLDGVCYLVPEGRQIRVGSSTDPHHVSPTASPQEIQALLKRVARLWPVEQATITEVSVGFRPVGPLVSGDPFVGPLDNHRPIWGLLGLYRNGILFTPELARYLVNTLFIEQPSASILA